VPIRDVGECEVGGDREWVDDAAGVESASRVPDPLELVEGAQHIRGVHHGQQRRPRTSVAVFAGQGTTVADHEFGCCGAESVHRRATGFGPQVKGDPHVHTACAEVAVHHAGESMLVEERGEVVEVVGETFGGDRGVFPTGPGFVAAADVLVVGVGEARRQTGAVFSDAPQCLSLDRIVDDGGLDHSALTAQVVEQQFGRGRHILFGLCCGAVLVDVDEQPGRSVRKTGDGVGSASGRHGGHDLAVDTLDGRRRERQDRGHVASRVGRGVVADAQQQCRRGRRDETDLGRHHDSTGALAADQCACAVETVLREQLCQVIARHLTWNGLQPGTEDAEIGRRQIV